MTAFPGIRLFPQIEDFVREIRAEEALIPATRKAQLRQLADYIREKLDRREKVSLHFICTHNSRRSHLAQIWATVAAAYFGMKGIRTFSGGTAATAFNPRAVAALERVGFNIENPDGENPKYRIRYSKEASSFTVWSKTFDAPENPGRDFAAILTCSEADENCPYIPGAAFRLALTYEDPKMADGTKEEQQRYNERVRQVGREIFWMFGQFQQALK